MWSDFETWLAQHTNRVFATMDDYGFLELPFSELMKQDVHTKIEPEKANEQEGQDDTFSERIDFIDQNLTLSQLAETPVHIFTPIKENEDDNEGLERNASPSVEVVVRTAQADFALSPESSVQPNFSLEIDEKPQTSRQEIDFDNDNTGGEGDANSTLTQISANDPVITNQVALNGLFSVTENGDVIITIADILNLVEDPDNPGANNLTVTAFDNTSAAGANIIDISGPGGITMLSLETITSTTLVSLNTGDTLIDSFSLTIEDDNGGVLVADIPVTVFGDTFTVPPIIIDLAGDGFSFTAPNPQAGGLIDNEGIVSLSGTGSDDVWLVYDHQQDGNITHLDEVSFAYGLDGIESDLQGLQMTHDSNLDSLFNEMDDTYHLFALWQDTNQNQQVDESEWTTLSSLDFELSLTPSNLTPQYLPHALVMGTTTALINGEMFTAGDVAVEAERISLASVISEPDPLETLIQTQLGSPSGELHLPPVNGAVEPIQYVEDTLVSEASENMMPGFG